MVSADKGVARVFFDLTSLEHNAALAFLREFSSLPRVKSLKESQKCHWIVSQSKAKALLESVDSGALFLKNRLEAGDRFVFLNPSGLDWSYLYPSEAQKEIDLIEKEWGAESWTFLAATTRALPWASSIRGNFFLPTNEGLYCYAQQTYDVFSWANPMKPGVHWISSGSALLVPLPEAPWKSFEQPKLTKTIPALETPLLPSQKIQALQLSAWRKGQNVPPSLSTLFTVNTEFPGLGDKDAVDFDEALSGIRKRALVANMQGVTDLNEGSLKLRFLNGSLVSIKKFPEEAPLCCGIQSYVQWKGRKHAFVTNSAFSFEGDFSWGLRQSLLLQHEDLEEAGRLIVDYFFVEESPELTISLTVRWPVWKTQTTIERWAALEMAFPAPKSFEALTAKSLWPDSSGTDTLVAKKHRQGVFAGCDFAFSAGKTAFVVGFPQNQTPRPYLLPWTWSKHEGKATFALNPEGSYVPTSSENLSGIEEHFTIYLNSSVGAKFPFTVTRKQATELIPPFVLSPRS